MLREQIRKDIEKQVIGLVGKWDGGVEVNRTSDPRFGDYTTNIALRAESKYQGVKVSRSQSIKESKKSRTDHIDTLTRRHVDTAYQSPLDFAKLLADKLKDLPYLEKLEVAGPGFLNFWIKPEVWVEEVEQMLLPRHSGNPASAGASRILKGKDSGQARMTIPVGLQNDKKGKKVIVEFTDPNPFKEFHIGHLYSNIVGESISRLLEATGAVVKRANYQGDVGMHVAKALYGLLRIKNYELRIKELEKESNSQRARFLGECYAAGAKAYEEDEAAKKEMAELNKKIFAGDPSVKELYQKGRQWSLDYFEEIYKRLGTKFDFYYFEGEVGKSGAELVKENLAKGIFMESEGAVIFPGEKYGLHNRVFINSLGLPTYEAKELGLAPQKYQDFAYDESIIITGNEINEYFKVLLAALGKIRPDLAAKTRHIGHGMVRMPGGKMSSRMGNVLLGEWLLDEAKKRVKEAFKDLPDELAEQIGTGAVKYSLLKQGIGGDIEFSFEESINLNGNSGPYLQYTYARCMSVLEKYERQHLRGEIHTAHPRGVVQLPSRPHPGGVIDLADLEGDDWTGGQDEEMLVLRELGFFAEAVADAAQRYSPSLAAGYLYGLAQKFNTFYNRLPILKADEPARTRRLFLTRATADILKEGLYLLGISAPVRM